MEVRCKCRHSAPACHDGEEVTSANWLQEQKRGRACLPPMLLTPIRNKKHEAKIDSEKREKIEWQYDYNSRMSWWERVWRYL